MSRGIAIVVLKSQESRSGRPRNVLHGVLGEAELHQRAPTLEIGVLDGDNNE